MSGLSFNPLDVFKTLHLHQMRQKSSFHLLHFQAMQTIYV